MISFFVEHEKFKLNKRKLLSNWIKETIFDNNAKVGDINFIYCDDDKILHVNNEYLGHNYYTDVITFDTSDYFSKKQSINGDIFISIDTVESNAKEYGSTFEEEFHRVTIHGILHLLGFNDLSDEERVVMREMENKYISKYFSL